MALNLARTTEACHTLVKANTALGKIFRQHLPEYGLVMVQFWTTVDPEKRPADPFGRVD